MPLVFIQLVLPAGQLREPVHVFLDDGGRGIKERIGSLALLEECIRILGSSAKQRPIRIQRPLAVCLDEFIIDHLPQYVITQLLDLGNFAAGPPSVKEMQQRQASPQAGTMSDRRKVVRLLHAVGTQHGETGLPAGHHVAVIAENRQGVRRQGTRRNVHDERR